MNSLSTQRYLNAFFDFDTYLKMQHSKQVSQGLIHEIKSDHGSLLGGIKHLKWDTRVLGVPCSMLTDIFWDGTSDDIETRSFCESIENALIKLESKFAFVRISFDCLDIINGFERLGWKTVDIMINYFLPLATFLKEEKEDGLENCSIGDVTMDEAMAFFERSPNLFQTARMHKDSVVNNDAANCFYRELYKSQFKKKKSVKVGIWKNNILTGLAIGSRDMSLYEDANFDLGYLWLIAIDPEFQRQGLAKKLLKEFFFLSKHKFLNIEIGTQVDHISANRLYSGLGLKQSSCAITLHRWF